MAALRVFSYLPNPRIFKATIAARLLNVDIEIRGAEPKALADWLWDFDAHPMSEAEREACAGLVQQAKTGFTTRLYKTAAFLDAHPFGTVPAAFSPDGSIGISESNSIMRAVARLGGGQAKLYGSDPYSASRIDGLLDATLLFAKDMQVYILGLRAGSVEAARPSGMADALSSYLGGIERTLARGTGFIAGDALSLVDIAFAAEMALTENESLHHRLLAEHKVEPLLPAARARFPRSFGHFSSLIAHSAFAPDLGAYMQSLEAAARAKG